MESFADRFRRLRFEARKSQAEVAEAIGVTHSNVSAYEHGTKEPKMSVLIAMARFFDVSIDYMCCITDERHGS